MPHHLASSFASAAAGENNDSVHNRGGGMGDWSRRANGSTQTFRRSSGATPFPASSYQRDVSVVQNFSPTQIRAVYVPPHLSATRNGNSQEYRYPREQLLDVVRDMSKTAAAEESVSELLAGTWLPSIVNGSLDESAKSEDKDKDGMSGLDVCWDREGIAHPLGLTEMTDEEKERFSTSVNSPLKPPAQSQSKEGMNREGLSLRKASLSVTQGIANPFGLSSPTSTKALSRRRETSHAVHSPSNTSFSGVNDRIPCDDSRANSPPPTLLRRRTVCDNDGQNGAGNDDRGEQPADDSSPVAAPFSSLKRSITGPYMLADASSTSPWVSASQSAGLSGVGALSNFAAGFSIEQNPVSAEKRPALVGLRSESKFKDLMSREPDEDVRYSHGGREPPSFRNFAKIREANDAASWMELRTNRPTSNDTDPYPDENYHLGSAALDGGEGSTPQRHDFAGFSTADGPGREQGVNFAHLGQQSDPAGYRSTMRSYDRHSLPHRTPQRQQHDCREPMSPTDTNPYRSPGQDDRDSAELANVDCQAYSPHLPGLGAFGGEIKSNSNMNAIGTLPNTGRAQSGFDVAGGDRSQTSSVGPTKAFTNAGGLTGIAGLGPTAGWHFSHASLGTPSREKLGYSSAFGELFSTAVGDLQLPSLAGIANTAVFDTDSKNSPGLIGHPPTIESLFPPDVQEDMPIRDQIRQEFNQSSNAKIRRRVTDSGGIGKGSFTSMGAASAAMNRESDGTFLTSSKEGFERLSGIADSGSQSARIFDGHYLTGDPAASASVHPQLSGLQQMPSLSIAHQNTSGQLQRGPSQFGPRQTQAIGSSPSNQPPAAQQRTMVMPDRMRWIYKDPQGNTQGPWSGLEMHDWYRAGFFSPELLVKKYEDSDYEPLAQLIRRIGNSREPFLVPQIGIPHGPPTSQSGNPWAGPSSGPSAVTSGSQAQPPFANSFPSFGTTLTAEQQNALERRKQEEQYLMARQKEHLAQQQVLVKQMQMQGQHNLHALQHHSSAQSLHSQPSFGSMTSPAAFHSSPNQGPLQSPAVPGFFDNSFRAAGASLGSLNAGADLLGDIKEEEVPALLDQLNLGHGAQGYYGNTSAPIGSQQQEQSIHELGTTSPRIAHMLNDTARLQTERIEHDGLRQVGQEEKQSSSNRLHEFLNLRAQFGDEMPFSSSQGVIGKPIVSSDEATHKHLPAMDDILDPGSKAQSTGAEPLSLAEQVQKAASAGASPWAKLDFSMPQPFPPPQPASPLPAPAARRSRQNVADALAAESRSRPDTPAAETGDPSVAPWAKEPADAPKGPSLKEIQEAEAREVAQADEVAAASRRAALGRESSTQALPPAPGLPSSSTWGNHASTSTPLNASSASAWTRPLSGKATVGPSITEKKKPLMQIQKEEEARKARAAAALVVGSGTSAANGAATSSSGKRYADLAGKVASPPANSEGSWTTVGASGKVRAPNTVPAPSAPQNKASAAPLINGNAVKPRTPVTTAKDNTATVQVNARDEFRKWAIEELRLDLKGDIKVDEFVQGLLNLPPDPEIITEAVHEYSRTLDSRHFAEEFIKRKKLADKGFASAGAPSAGPRRNSPAAHPGADGKGGGWSEVAKKGPAVLQERETEVPGFRVIAKKKSGKR